MENDIVQDSYYLVSLFLEDDLSVTQLQIQKLMYFVEALYMNEKDVDFLYECPFKAWALGPVAIPLYKEYKNFKDSSIVLQKEKIDLGKKISSIKKEIIGAIYDSFGKKYTAIQLVNVTHMPNSPWEEKWLQNNRKVLYGPESNMDKLKTKKWFKENFIKSDE